MLVLLKRDWFAPGGVYLEKGTREYNGSEKELPSDAIVLSADGTIPVRENTPKPGFGAKPLEEQVLDLIPGAGKTHLISDPGGPTPPGLTDEEKKEAQAEQDRRRADETAAATKDDEAAAAELKKETAAGLKNAEKAAEAITKATDPIQGLFKDEPAKPGKK